jgi:hypothetical protein
MSNIDQMEAVRSDLVSGCQKPDRSTPAKIKLCWLRPRRADAPFRACLPRQVPFKAERLASSGFVVRFADGSTVEVTEAQLQSEQRFRDSPPDLGGLIGQGPSTSSRTERHTGGNIANLTGRFTRDKSHVMGEFGGGLQAVGYQPCLALGREFAAQSQSSWGWELAHNGIVGWTDRARAYDRYLDEWLDRGWQRELEIMAGVYDGPKGC